MLDQILNDLNQPDFFELSDSYWLNLCTLLPKITEASERNTLFQALAAHTGIPKPLLSQTLIQLSEKSEGLDQKQLLLTLNEKQRIATESINLFLITHSYFENTDLSPLAMTRKEWLAIIAKFVEQERKIVTSVFFISLLSQLRNTTFDHIKQALTKPQPAREVKQEKENTPVTPPKRRGYVKDNGENPLILPEQSPSPLQERLSNRNVRFTRLESAPSVKGYGDLPISTTPGGSTVRALCTIGTKTFFKRTTPEKAMKGRVTLNESSLEDIKKVLPRLNLHRLEPIRFIATLETINERSGTKRRQDQKALTKAKASDVFRAYGVEIRAADGKKHHWAHVRAHFLGGEADTSNLVPSTSAANYNTLEAVELNIRELLTSKRTAAVEVVVEPVYRGEALIPEVLTYRLEWQELIDDKMQSRKESFNINPQSHERFTQSMYDSFNEVRNDLGPKR